MVIHQFNKLIRNKWVWGVFAIAISAFFAFDFLVADIGREAPERGTGAGLLGGEQVSASVFADIAEEIRGFGQQRDWKRSSAEVNREAWENYAALKVAGQDGLEATDSEVQAMIRRDPSFQRNGGFSFALYQALLRQNGLTPERFEAYLKRRVTLMRIGQAVLASAAWASPMELDSAVADMTDTFTVKVAKFTQDPKDAEAVKLDDAGLKKWYDDNQKTLELPERIKIRSVKFSATDPMVLAKMTVSTNEMQDYFDVNVGLTERVFETVGAQVPRFVYFSSSKADAHGNAYGRSKLAAERYLDGRAIVLRPAMIHGPGNKGNLNLLWGIARRGLPWPRRWRRLFQLHDNRRGAEPARPPYRNPIAAARADSTRPACYWAYPAGERRPAAAAQAHRPYRTCCAD